MKLEAIRLTTNGGGVTGDVVVVDDCLLSPVPEVKLSTMGSFLGAVFMAAGREG